MERDAHGGAGQPRPDGESERTTNGVTAAGGNANGERTKGEAANGGAADGRKTYYVAVGSGEVLEDKGAAAFEFEIRANEAELNRLQKVFAEMASDDESAMYRYSGWLSASEEEMNAVTDGHLRNIYRLLYELGTEETKRHIAAMNVLEDRGTEHRGTEGRGTERPAD